MKTALIHHPIFKNTTRESRAPETPRRYEVVMKALKTMKTVGEFDGNYAGKSGERFDPSCTHAAALQKNRSAFGEGVEYLDADTIVFDAFV
jgi:hypothetical protein